MNRATPIAALLCISISSTLHAATAGLAKVNSGELQGEIQGQLVVYKGVPFAAPPVGALRWRDPQPVKSWQGIRDATKFSRPCTQPITPYMPQGMAPGEDCLYLNVWAPIGKPTRPLPVMFWIHGGGFATGGGSAPLFDGTRLANRGVIVVSINYRLGALGFLAHADLTKESGRPSGNYGLKDQLAALHWVQTNIAKMGGDPNNVTIFGQSAGAGSVSMLAASKLAKGLFQRAIAESGASFAPPTPEGGMVSDLEDAEQTGKAAFAQLGVATVDEARALPAENVIALKLPFRPTREGYVLPLDQYKLYEADAENDTPVLVGYNSADGVTRPLKPSEFEAQIRRTYGTTADAILAAYPHATDTEKERSALEIARDAMFGWNAWAWARLQSHYGKHKVYTYYFDQVAPKDSVFYSPNGTVHTGEIPYVFGSFNSPPASYTDEDKALSEQVESYWVNFAKTGDPNGPALPKWPSYDDSNPHEMDFHGTAKAASMQSLPKLKAFDVYYQALRKRTTP